MSGPHARSSALALWLMLSLPISAASSDPSAAASSRDVSVASLRSEAAVPGGQSAGATHVDIGPRQEHANLADTRGRSIGLLMGVLIGLAFWLTRRRLGD